MDHITFADELSLSQIFLYASMSFLIVSLLGVFLYITCSKKYKLNWFEKNLLETATTNDERRQSQEVLINCSAPYNDAVAGSSRSLNRTNGSPTSNTDDPTFWVPHFTMQHQPHGDHSSSADESSQPQSPSSPTSSNRSVAGLSVTSSTAAIPIARNDKHVVLTCSSPARPKMSSMQHKLDHTKIDMALYQDQNSPTKELLINEDLRGTIHITMVYDAIAGILTVRIIEAHDLQPRDFSGTADPYAKVRLLPDKTNVWQTRIHKKTLNPVFDEDFVFEVRPAIIGRKTLEILLYDFDSYSRHVCIGGLQIALNNVDLADRVEMWKPLGPCAEKDSKVDLGDLMISLAYLPSAERLTVVVVKARNLRVVDDTRNSSDPYIKVSLIHNGKRMKKRKTAVLRNTVAPVFNEALIFDVGKDTLKHCMIEFLAMHDSLLGANEVLGRAFVGNAIEVRQEERIFFDEMFRTKTATAWVPLHDPRNQENR